MGAESRRNRYCFVHRSERGSTGKLHSGQADGKAAINAAKDTKTVDSALTKVKMAFDYRIYLASDPETIMVEGHTQNVFTSMETGKITRLPEKYYDKLAKAMKE